MLEKALISGVTHTLEETLYRVEGITPARLFAALAEAGVNVDTIIQTGSGDRLLGPGRGPRGGRRVLDGLGVEWTARDDLGKVSVIGAGMKSHPGIAAKAFETLDRRGHRAAGRDHLADQDRLPRSRPARSRPRCAALHRAFELDAPEAERQHA